VTRAGAPPKPVPPPKTSVAAKSEAKSPLIPKPPPRPSHAPSKGGLDRQTARKLDTGRLSVEARLDLHGMRQRDAHVALRKFLKWAQSKDYRHVLVITGKGSLRDHHMNFYEDEARGILRQAVPHWLSHGDLAPLIVSYSEAPRRLGGKGALYVRLRKPDHARRKTKG
jgi:DNA-nicking Smr family endonuclease